jgi:DnaJ-class molecular chaperone
MVNDMALYDILEVKGDATQDEIKKAYRRLSKIHHPDKNKDNDDTQFKKLNMANSVLSVPEKRKKYDMMGMNSLKDTTSSDGASFTDIFSDIFGRGVFGGMFRSAAPQPPPRRCLLYTIDVDLEELFQGSIKKLKITNDVVCVECNGRRSTHPEGIIKCLDCKGTGMITRVMNMGGMIMHQNSQCGKCACTGKIFNQKFKCSGCEGKGVMASIEIVQIDIKPGSLVTDNITVMDSGGQPKLVVKFNTRAHPVYTVKNGTDITMKKTITLKEALLGYTFDILYLDGKTYTISNKAIYRSDRPYNSLPNMGMGFKGMLDIQVVVDYPTEISDDLRLIIAEL